MNVTNLKIKNITHCICFDIKADKFYLTLFKHYISGSDRFVADAFNINTKHFLLGSIWNHDKGKEIIGL